MAELARCYDGELEVYEYAAFLNGRLIFSEPEVVGNRPAHGSVFTLEGAAIVSAVKAAENPEKLGIIVRLFCGMHEGGCNGKARVRRAGAPRMHLRSARARSGGACRGRRYG